MRLITLEVSASSARFLFRSTIARRLPLQYRPHGDHFHALYYDKNDLCVTLVRIMMYYKG